MAQTKATKEIKEEPIEKQLSKAFDAQQFLCFCLKVSNEGERLHHFSGFLDGSRFMTLSLEYRLPAL